MRRCEVYIVFSYFLIKDYGEVVDVVSVDVVACWRFSGSGVIDRCWIFDCIGRRKGDVSGV